MSPLRVLLAWLFCRVLRYLAQGEPAIPPSPRPRYRPPRPQPPADFSHLAPRADAASWAEIKRRRASPVGNAPFAHLRGCAPFTMSPLPSSDDGD